MMAGNDYVDYHKNIAKSLNSLILSLKRFINDYEVVYPETMEDLKMIVRQAEEEAYGG